MAPCLIGVDGGTESLRAGMSGLRGRPLDFAAAPYATRLPRLGWAERDPANWWAARGGAVRQAAAEAGVRISGDGHRAHAALNPALGPLHRRLAREG